MALRKLSPLISKLEIERKFLPTLPLLHALTGTPVVQTLPFSILRGAENFIRDVYFDSPDGRLSTKGLWVRRRDLFVVGNDPSTSSSSWEAKVRVGGDFVASQFVEVEGAGAVERELRRVLGVERVSVETLGQQLGVMCDLTARRVSGRVELSAVDHSDAVAGLRQWQNLTVSIDQVVETAADDFTAARAVLERMSYGRKSSHDIFFHEIGELEVVGEVRTEARATGEDREERQTHEHDMRRQAVGAACATQLEAFMGVHPALFPMTPPPRGKLVAYFAWKEEKTSRGVDG